MRAVVQRVTAASVRVGETVLGRIGRGYVVLVAVHAADTAAEARALAEKIAHLRIFDDAEGRLNRSLLDVGGEVLSVSQFTLYGNTEKGRRPSFLEAAPAERAEALYEVFNERLRALGVPVVTGRFRAVMSVEIHNDGPVTLLLEVPPPAGR
ncbi:MAG TPA: D-aminoacyl-tRNA deacylase [bacterium]|nr:D-aminoacyl-tRNA deacylase [bacterium]